MTGRNKINSSFSDHARGQLVADYVRNYLVIPKNASLSGWVPQGWLESTFRCARKFFAGTSVMAVKVGKKGQGGHHEGKIHQFRYTT
jgi:hypothetical protein